MKQRSGTILLIVAIVVLILMALFWVRDSSSQANLGLKFLPVTQVDRGITDEFRAETLETIKKLESGISLGGEDPQQIWFELGNLRYSLGDLLGAKLAYEQFLAIEPNHALALENLGQTLFEMKEFDRAEKRLTESLFIEPREDVFLKLADLLRDEEVARGDELKPLLEDALSTLGDQPSILASLGDWYMDSGDKHLAREHYERALLLDPENKNIKNSLELL